MLYPSSSRAACDGAPLRELPRRAYPTLVLTHSHDLTFVSLDFRLKDLLRTCIKSSKGEEVPPLRKVRRASPTPVLTQSGFWAIGFENEPLRREQVKPHLQFDPLEKIDRGR